MMHSTQAERRWTRWGSAILLVCLLVLPASAASIQQKKQKARTQFETAERMREELNGLPQKERSHREYQRVMDAYRRVYYTAPASSKADASVVAVAELLAESGRAFSDERELRAAISQFEFLRREYPGSKYRFDALFTIGQIYKEDLGERDKARESFLEVIHRYPRLQLSADAREAIAELDQQARAKEHQRPQRPEAAAQQAAPENHAAQPRQPEPKVEESHTAEVSDDDSAHTGYPRVTGIRHWSTPDYTRVAIDLEQEVQYEAGRVSGPDRIFFDLHNSRLASTLVGKSFEVSDGFLRRVRVAQFQKGMVRVVLEVDAVSDYSVFLLPNPYRLIVDIHGRKPNPPQTMLARAEEQHQPAKEAQAEIPPPRNEAAQPAAANGPQQPQSARPAPTVVAVLPAPTQPAAAPPDAPDPNRAVKSVPEFGPRLPDGSFASQSREVVGGVWPKTTEPMHAKSNSTKLAGKAWPNPETQPDEPAPAEPNKTAATEKPAAEPAISEESTKTEVSKLGAHEEKATEQPTSAPTAQVVAPRIQEKVSPAEKPPVAEKKSPRIQEARQAKPSSDGQRSLIRALGLKVGRIVIDAGHGGHDTGTIGPNGLLEKDLVLDVSLRLGRLLQGRMGAEVVYTRDDDTFIPLETRTAIANQQQADLFISVHANSSQDASARGVETYYLNFNPSPDALEVAARENAVSEKSVHELGDLVKKIALKEKVEESREFATDVQHSLYQGWPARRRRCATAASRRLHSSFSSAPICRPSLLRYRSSPTPTTSASCKPPSIARRWPSRSIRESPDILTGSAV